MTTHTEDPKFKVVAGEIAQRIAGVMTGLEQVQQATQRATNAAHALNGYIERAQSIFAIAFVRKAIDREHFAHASPKTRRRWIERLEAKVTTDIREAMSCEEVCFMLNATCTVHLFPASDETRAHWNAVASARIKQLETNMNDKRTDKERAEFVVKLKDAEVILSMRSLRFVEAILPLCRNIAGGAGEFTASQRESIDMLMTQHGGSV
jgi:hypothetical protein